MNMRRAPDAAIAHSARDDVRTRARGVRDAGAVDVGSRNLRVLCVGDDVERKTRAVRRRETNDDADRRVRETDDGKMRMFSTRRRKRRTRARRVRGTTDLA